MAPSYSLTPSFAPSSVQPTFIPSPFPSQKPHTAFPTAIFDYRFRFVVAHVWKNLDCATIQRDPQAAKLISSAVIASATDSSHYKDYYIDSLGVFYNYTTFPGWCNFSYYLKADHTLSLGFLDADSAYNSTLVKLTNAYNSGSYLQNWLFYLKQFGLEGKYGSSMQCIVLKTSGYFSEIPKPNDEEPSAKRTPNFSSGEILTMVCIIVVAVFCAPVICFSLYVKARQLWSHRNKIFAMPQRDVEMVSAHFMNEEDCLPSAPPDDALPKAKIISAMEAILVNYSLDPVAVTAQDASLRLPEPIEATSVV
jgi:hypothetical protein